MLLFVIYLRTLEPNTICISHAVEVEQELLTLSNYISCHSGFSGICVVRSLVFCVVFCSVCSFVPFLLAIAVSVLITPLVSSKPF